MKRNIIFSVLTIFMAIGGYNTIYAQLPEFSIFDSLEAPPEEGQGVITIQQPEALRKLIGTRIDSENVELSEGKTYITTLGYRVKVYKGNLERVSREEAEALQLEIKKLFPDLDSDLRYYSPFWELHVGSFLSFEEALPNCRELLKKFPKKKNEIYVIEADIRLSLD